MDGYDDKTNTIYEYLGDYWHGNPVKFNANHINKRCGKTCGELYHKTFQRLNNLKSMGYIVKYIWEHDWKQFKRGIDKSPKISTL